MDAHRTVLATGPGAVTRLCCGTVESGDAGAVALEWIDDPTALLDGEPVAVRVLWASVLASLSCPERSESVLLIHPSWWSASRVELIREAARTRWDGVGTRARAELLAADAAVVIEIAADLVAITSAGTVAEPRIGPPAEVADAVARRVAVIVAGTVVLDAPAGILGAPALAALITARLRAVGRGVELAQLLAPAPPEPQPAPRKKPHRLAPYLTAAAAAALLVVGAQLAIGGNHSGPPDPTRTAFLVEGRVTVEVPADWPVRRVTDGPGSARVEVISPTDPQTMLHLTQARVPDPTLQAIAEALDRAVRQANEQGEIFVDFNPAGASAGRSAVTYREVRDGHHIDWAVLVDGTVRIGIGCQSRGDGTGGLGEVCQRAVRSARALPPRLR